MFAQLDFDGSGGISFKEFLIGLEKMVMEEYDDPEGEEVRLMIHNLAGPNFDPQIAYFPTQQTNIQ